MPLSVTTDIGLLEEVVANQTEILQTVFNETDVSTIPQVWCLCTNSISPFLLDNIDKTFQIDKEVEGYYDDGMRVPDYITLLWTDDK